MADTRKDRTLYDPVSRAMERSGRLASALARRRAGERKSLRQNLLRDAEEELMIEAQLAREVC